jgi:hypothetical protein
MAEVDQGPQAKKKCITSLLLTATAAKRDHARALSALRRVLSEHQLSPDSIEVKDSQQSGDEQEYIIDFSDEVDVDLEDHAFLTQFMRFRERLLFEILQEDAVAQLCLSAMIVVSPEITVFGLVAPKVPAAISSSAKFDFHYSVWHVAGPCAS